MQLCDEGVKEIYGLTGHGAHAKYMKCPASAIVELPEELTFETGAAIACGTGTAWGALNRLDLKGDQTIAIFGQGPVGLSSTQLTHGLGAHASIDASSSASARNTHQWGFEDAVQAYQLFDKQTSGKGVLLF